MKTPGGVSHLLAPSACFIGPTGARLYFGRYPWDRDAKPRETLYINVDREPGSQTRAGIADGELELLRPNFQVTPVGSARLQDGLRRGSFTFVESLGGGAKGKRVFTGHWDCGTPHLKQ